MLRIDILPDAEPLFNRKEQTARVFLPYEEGHVSRELVVPFLHKGHPYHSGTFELDPRSFRVDPKTARLKLHRVLLRYLGPVQPELPLPESLIPRLIDRP